MSYDLFTQAHIRWHRVFLFPTRISKPTAADIKAILVLLDNNDAQFSTGYRLSSSRVMETTKRFDFTGQIPGPLLVDGSTPSGKVPSMFFGGERVLEYCEGRGENVYDADLPLHTLTILMFSATNIRMEG